MGGLFSSNDKNDRTEVPPRAYVGQNTYVTPRNYSNYSGNTIQNEPTYIHSGRYIYSGDTLQRESTYNQSFRSLIREREFEIRLSEGFRQSNLRYFPKATICTIPSSRSTYEVWELSPIESEYKEIKARISNRYFKVDSIEVIHAPYLKKSYELKKKQQRPLEELELFHGTKLENVDSICKNNFNWRYHGEHVGNRFGQGVSFSCNAMYAANYSTDVGAKVMFIAKVMIGRRCLGRKGMELPDDGCDTSAKQDDNIVLVKYEDNEFYPIYRIRFHIAPGYVPMNKRKKNRNWDLH